MLAVLIILVVVVLLYLILGLIIIRQSETMVIERLGKYHKTLVSGINLINPILDRSRTVEWKYTNTDFSGRTIITKKTITRIDLRETVYDFPRQSVITKDNVVIEINAMIYFQITDPKRSVYEIANLPDAIEKLTQTTLRNIIGQLDLDHTLSSRDTINNELRIILDEATDKWGLKINRVELQDIIPPEDIKVAMEKQMRAERDRRALILQAEGMKQSKILESEGIRLAEVTKAEGFKDAAVLKATGEAEAIFKVTSAIKEANGNPTAYLIALKYMDTLKEISSGKDNKIIYMPYEATALLSSIGSIKDLFNTPNLPPTPPVAPS
jgi:regulator of protease activity HflC (stomatin/prohibitin superfamily)